MVAAAPVVANPQLTELWKHTVPVSSGKVAVWDDVNVARLRVSLLDPVPRTSWLVLLDKLRVEKVGLLAVAISCGVDRVMVPAPLVTLT